MPRSQLWGSFEEQANTEPYTVLVRSTIAMIQVRSSAGGRRSCDWGIVIGLQRCNATVGK